MITSSSQESVSNDFLHLASEVIRDDQSTEGALRAAISRAYYAVFLTIRDKLFGPDQTGLTREKRKRLHKRFKLKRERDPGSHELLLFAITDVMTQVSNPVTLYQQVDQLREARIHADYDFTSANLSDILADNWREYATENIELASQLLPMARRLPSYPH